MSSLRFDGGESGAQIGSVKPPAQALSRAILRAERVLRVATPSANQGRGGTAMSRRLNLAAMVTVAMLVQTGAAQAAEGLDGAGFGVAWALPFVGILLCIALGPLLFAHTWEHHQGKISAAWGV